MNSFLGKLRTAPARARHPRGASVMVIVLVTLMFAALALTMFIERAGTDLLVDVRVASAARLRLEASSALETTLGVLEEFRDVLGGLRSPQEGWDKPLEFAGYEPEEGRLVEVLFSDESGKISLPNADQTVLVNVFKGWSFSPSDAERLADALLGWSKDEYTATSAAAPQAMDYQQGETPFTPPKRALRSFTELASINVVRELFFAENGQPNEHWRRFTESFSLYSYRSPNINAAAPDLLASAGATDTTEQARLSDYLQGAGLFQGQGPRYFKSANEVSTLLGKQSAATQFGTEIRALRIRVLVTEGTQCFELSVLVSIGNNGAKVAATSKPEAQAASSQTETAAQGGAAAATAQNTQPSGSTTATVEKLNYPFTFLDYAERVVPLRPEAPPAER